MKFDFYIISLELHSEGQDLTYILYPSVQCTFPFNTNASHGKPDVEAVLHLKDCYLVISERNLFHLRSEHFCPNFVSNVGSEIAYLLSENSTNSALVGKGL